jgi:hypothetical protein
MWPSETGYHLSPLARAALKLYTKCAVGSLEVAKSDLSLCFAAITGSAEDS